MDHWTPQDHRWLALLDRYLAEVDISLDALAGDRAEDLRDVIMDAAGSYLDIRFRPVPEPTPVPARWNRAGTKGGTTRYQYPAGTKRIGTRVGTALVPAVGTGTTQLVPADEVGTTPVPVPIKDGTKSGTGTTPLVPVLVPAQRQAVPAGTGPGTTTVDELTELGTKWYRESMSAGTKPMSERALAERMGQTGRRLARQIIASVRSEMAQEGAHNA